MKFFTVKDFIIYNNPCINCNKNISLYFEFIDRKNGSRHAINDLKIENNVLIINLKNKYKNFTSLNINLIKNSIKTKHGHFSSILKSYLIHFSIRCLPCNNVIVSSILEFENNNIKPFYIQNEFLNIYQNNKTISIFTHEKDDLSSIHIYNNSNVYDVYDVYDFSALPLHKFKTKEKFLDKISKIITFS